jgi:hypothetical protein
MNSRKSPYAGRTDEALRPYHNPEKSPRASRDAVWFDMRASRQTKSLKIESQQSRVASGSHRMIVVPIIAASEADGYANGY